MNAYNFKLFECKHCRLSFVYQGSLDVHLENTHDVAPANGPSSSKKRAAKKTAKRKLEDKKPKPKPPEPTSYQCPNAACGKIFSQKRSFQQHKYFCNRKQRFSQTKKSVYQSRTVIKKFQCDYCPFVASSKTSFDLHFKARHRTTHGSLKLPAPVVTLKCSKCSQIFYSQAALASHISQTHSAKVYKCSGCDCTASTRTDLSLHVMKDHHSGTSYICVDCLQECKSKTALYLHRKEKHTAEYACEVCNAQERRTAFSYKHHLTRHMKRYHSTAECTKCGREFDSRAELKQHDAAEHQSRNECEVCHKVFTIASSLHDHMAHTHLKVFRHRCDVCGKGFARKRLLTAHQAAYDSDEFATELHRAGFKPWTKAAKDWMEEQRKPATERRALPFLCDRVGCMHAAASQELLNTHMLDYHPLSEDDKRCPHCNKTFKSVTLLNKHEKKTRCSQKRMKCEFCDHVCSNKQVWLLHRRKKHKAEVERIRQEKEMEEKKLPPSKKKEREAAAARLKDQQEKMAKLPYQCDVSGCGFGARTDKMLYNHKFAKHSRTRHVCDDCGRNFSTGFNLRVHCDRIHNKTLAPRRKGRKRILRVVAKEEVASSDDDDDSIELKAN